MRGQDRKAASTFDGRMSQTPPNARCPCRRSTPKAARFRSLRMQGQPGIWAARFVRPSSVRGPSIYGSELECDGDEWAVLQSAYGVNYSADRGRIDNSMHRSERNGSKPRDVVVQLVIATRYEGSSLMAMMMKEESFDREYVTHPQVPSDVLGAAPSQRQFPACIPGARME